MLGSASMPRGGSVVRLKPGGAGEPRISPAPLLPGEAARSGEAPDCPLPLHEAPRPHANLRDLPRPGLAGRPHRAPPHPGRARGPGFWLGPHRQSRETEDGARTRASSGTGRTRRSPPTPLLARPQAAVGPVYHAGLRGGSPAGPAGWGDLCGSSPSLTGRRVLEAILFHFGLWPGSSHSAPEAAAASTESHRPNPTRISSRQRHPRALLPPRGRCSATPLASCPPPVGPPIDPPLDNHHLFP